MFGQAFSENFWRMSKFSINVSDDEVHFTILGMYHQSCFSPVSKLPTVCQNSDTQKDLLIYVFFQLS